MQLDTFFVCCFKVPSVTKNEHAVVMTVSNGALNYIKHIYYNYYTVTDKRKMKMITRNVSLCINQLQCWWSVGPVLLTLPKQSSRRDKNIHFCEITGTDARNLNNSLNCIGALLLWLWADGQYDGVHTSRLNTTWMSSSEDSCQPFTQIPQLKIPLSHRRRLKPLH